MLDSRKYSESRKSQESLTLVQDDLIIARLDPKITDHGKQIFSWLYRLAIISEIILAFLHKSIVFIPSDRQVFLRSHVEKDRIEHHKMGDIAFEDMVASNRLICFLVKPFADIDGIDAEHTRTWSDSIV